jgi:hypothetical protein
MNIALFAASGLWSPLQVWLRRLMPGELPPLIDQRASTCVSSIHIGQKPSRLAQRRPLRIVRILETGQSSTQVGRMVISGRMADVCAELDRLASIDATPH